MSVYRRGRVYWFDFVWNGERVQKSTRQGNRKAAIDIESAFRTSLAKGEVGIAPKEKSAPIPTLGEFLELRFLPWAESTFTSKTQTWLYYRQGVRRMGEYKPLASTKLNEVTGEGSADYAAKRRADGLAISSVNRQLQVLRRALHLAVEWGVLASAPKIKMLPGEEKRERVITATEEQKFLAAAAAPLAVIALVLVNTGMRPEECFRLRWENLNWHSGRYGTLQVTHGKTAAAQRVIPMTPRVRAALEACWKQALKPEEGWVWPASTRSGHIEPSSLRKQHAKAFKTIADEASQRNGKPVRPFVLYSLRHTFLTRLGESGCDAWTLARIAGHSSIAISARYVHPSDNAVIAALGRMGGGEEQKLLQ
jgi:integrase